MKLYIPTLFFILSLSAAAFGQSIKVLPESEVSFSVSNLSVNTVRGTLGDFRGEGQLNLAQPEQSNFEVSVGAATVKTGIGRRDRHLLTDEFFNVEAFPRITVTSGDVMHAAAEGSYHFSGELTIKDISQPISCTFTLKEEGGHSVLEGSFTVARADFELGPSFGTFVIGEEVEVHVKLVCDVR